LIYLSYTFVSQMKANIFLI